MPIPKPERRVRYVRKWSVEQKKRIINEVIAARATKVRGAVTFVLNKYLIKTQHMAEWRHDLIRLGEWDVENGRPKA